MMLLRRADERSHANHGWLDSHHTFSFAITRPQWMGFGPLRVISGDRVAAGNGFAPTATERSFLRDRGRCHRDSTGSGSVMRPATCNA